MILNITSKVVLLLIFIAMGCTGKQSELVTRDYQESREDFPNPERGFYQYSVTLASNYSPLSEAELKGYRNPTSASGANYAVVSTLLFRYFILDDFKSKRLSDDYLNKVKTYFATVRAAGLKIIVRFT